MMWARTQRSPRRQRDPEEATPTLARIIVRPIGLDEEGFERSFDYTTRRWERIFWGIGAKVFRVTFETNEGFTVETLLARNPQDAKRQIVAKHNLRPLVRAARQHHTQQRSAISHARTFDRRARVLRIRAARTLNDARAIRTYKEAAQAYRDAADAWTVAMDARSEAGYLTSYETSKKRRSLENAAEVEELIDERSKRTDRDMRRRAR